jgi:hypothetical protein
MIVGAYWSQRKESMESASARVAAFLAALSSHGAEFLTWYRKGKSRAAALRSPLNLDAASIASELKPSLRDMDRQPMPELGFEFAAWNGSRASFSAHVGAWSPYVRNAAVLSLSDSERFGEDSCRAVLEQMVRVFDPDHAVVTSHEHLAKIGVANPWEAGWFTYHRGENIEKHAFE